MNPMNDFPPMMNDPQYNLRDVEVFLELPDLPRPSFTRSQVRIFLRSYFASTCYVPSDHQFIKDMVNRFPGNSGHDLYSASQNDMERWFGELSGRRLYLGLASSKYSWVSYFEKRVLNKNFRMTY